MKGIYLGKAGKIFGPLSDGDMNALKKSGELQAYHWIWDQTGALWKPLEPAPVLKPEQAFVGDVSTEQLRVILHDVRHLLAGKMEHVTETGCELRTTSSSVAPQFLRGSKLFLNLFHAKSGQHSNVPTELVNVAKAANEWVYSLKWGACPELLRG